MAILAVVAGLFSGMVILVFRLAVDFVLGNWLLSEGSESFEGLPYIERFALPVIGASLLGVLLTRLSDADRRVGVVHVMERLSRHQGYLPIRNAIVQFFGGIIALVSGQAGGREGPAIHLGAASSSLLGQALKLPNNSIRTLVACGTAAAIAASFNTPIAGVIFAMEVVMMEYTIGSFIPVIIAAVTSTLLTYYFVGSDPAFNVAPLHLESLLEIPYIAFAGVIIGAIAAGFIFLVQAFARFGSRPFWLRALLAGSLTGCVAIIAPEVMGVGYDTVNGAMLGQIALSSLLLIVVLKVLTSAAAVGLGLPVGLIGPTFVIGAAVGGALGIIGGYLQPTAATSTGFYVMLGMAAMMAAVLQAPLAALLAVMELTANPNLVLPAMLIIVVATMVTSVVFKQKGVFLSTLDTLGLQYPPDPITLHLQRAGVGSIMNRDVARLPHICTLHDAKIALAGKPRWIVVETAPGEIRCVLSASDLMVYLEDQDARSAETNSEVVDACDNEEEDEQLEVCLLDIPGERKDVVNIDIRATIEQAQQALRDVEAEALCVRRVAAPLIESVLGV
ncbi:MAG: chloride channel protein, partial [Pseudomonadales bacterium]